MGKKDTLLERTKGEVVSFLEWYEKINRTKTLIIKYQILFHT